ncbi:hypothetical protein ACJMK2_025622 [Sinanodonta woodiana]|uniref:Ig-like domain-containing protein n=1 Tax=Sinanodonta woodiana TaxID=1069815 RepID=A0ABD3XIZ2_SINWO
MAEFRRILLLVTLVNADAGVLSEAGNNLKYVCQGDSVQAFQNIDFDRCNSRIVLKMNGERDKLIAFWSMQNCTQNATLAKVYKDRVFLDQNQGTITIHNLHYFDQGKYVVISWKDKLPSIKETEINVMVPPSKDCKPTIVRLGSKLYASLKVSDCGTPVPTLYWKSNGGINDTNQPILTITQGTEYRTYYACIQSPALQCSKSQMPQDYCSNFTIDGNPEKPQNYKTSIQSVQKESLLPETQTSTVVNESDVEMQHLSRVAEPSTAVISSNDPQLGQKKHPIKREEIGPYGDCCTFCGKGRKAMFILSCEHFGHQYMPACFECGNSYLPCKRCRALHTHDLFR